MPSGKTHDFFNIIILVAAVALVFLTTWLSENVDEDVLKNSMILFLGAYVFSTFMLSPDLDLKKNRSKLNWGFLRWIWWPYSKVMKHRGISHSILFGVLTRVFYVYTVYLIVLFLFYFFGDFDMDELPFWFVGSDEFEWEYLISMLVGFYFPSIFHTLLDNLVTKEKRKK
jgi:uncharacterized metal-binding protein